MPTPVIPLLPDPPVPSDSPPVFADKAGAFVTRQALNVPILNASFQWIADQGGIIDGYRAAAALSAQYAAAAADRAEAVDTNVSEQVQAAQAAAANAAASAAAAESAPGSIGNLALIHSMTIGMIRGF